MVGSSWSGSEGLRTSSATGSWSQARRCQGPCCPLSAQEGFLLGHTWWLTHPSKSTYEYNQNTRASATRSGLRASRHLCAAGSGEVTSSPNGSRCPGHRLVPRSCGIPSLRSSIPEKEGGRGGRDPSAPPRPHLSPRWRCSKQTSSEWNSKAMPPRVPTVSSHGQRPSCISG